MQQADDDRTCKTIKPCRHRERGIYQWSRNRQCSIKYRMRNMVWIEISFKIQDALRIVIIETMTGTIMDGLA
jgi:hypothetical protein